MATKTVYICDYCGKEQSTPLKDTMIRIAGSGVQFLFHEFGELCEPCVSHICDELHAKIEDIGDGVYDH